MLNFIFLTSVLLISWQEEKLSIFQVNFLVCYSSILYLMNYWQQFIMSLNHWHSTCGFEVDLIIGDKLDIEVKISEKIQKRDLKGLRALMEEDICKKFFLVSFDEVSRIIDGIEIINWKEFLKRLTPLLLE